MRVTKGHTGNRRSHHGIKAPRLSVCSNCKSYHERHRICLECGFYKGKKVIDVKNKKDLVVKADKAKTEDKKTVKKEKEITKKETVKKTEAKKTVKKEVKKVQSVKKNKTTQNKG